MTIRILSLLFLAMNFSVLHAYSSTEDALLSKVHTVTGTFGAYDFTPTNDKGPFDWAFTTTKGQSYQLQGKAPTAHDVFGWLSTSITAPTPLWSMFPLDIDENGITGPFEWILVQPKINGAVYKLDGVSTSGTFKYSNKILLGYTISGNSVTFTSDTGPASSHTDPTNDIVIDTPAKAKSAAKAAASFLGSATSLTGSLGGLTSLYSSPALRALRYSSTYPCSSGGSMAINVNETTLYSGTLDATVNYNNCSESGTIINGSLVMGGSINISTGTVSNITMTFSNFSSTSGTTSSSFNGTMTLTSATAGSTMNLVLNATTTMTVDGITARFVYTNYNLSVTGTSSTVNGTVLVDYTPDSCSDGTYHIQTITPITTDGNGNLTGGSIKVNGQLYTIHSNGTMTTVIGGETVTIDQNYELEFCD